MPLTEPARIAGAVLDHSMEGWDWTGHAFVDSRLTVGHYYQPHPPSDQSSNMGHYDHYFVFRNFTLRESIEYQVPWSKIEVDSADYELEPKAVKDPDFYLLRIPNARTPFGADERYRGPIGHLYHGAGRVQTKLELKLGRGPSAIPERLDLDSDGDWSPMRCPCCSRWFHLS